MPDVDLSGTDLAPLQKLAWLGRATPGAAVVQAAFVLEGAADTAALEGALARVVAVTDALRLSLRQPPGLRVPVQFLDPGSAACHGRVRLDTPCDTRLHAILARERDAVEKAEPLFRSLVVAPGDDDPLLVLTASRVCADAVTLIGVMRRVAAAAAGAEPAPDAVPYPRLAQWLSYIGDSEEGAAGVRFWRSRLAGGRLPAPVRPAGEAAVFASKPVATPLPDAGALRALCAHGAAGEVDVLLAAWARYWGRVHGEDDEPVGWVDAGRALDALRDAAGPLTGCVPLRLAVLDSDPRTAVQRACVERQQAAEFSAVLPSLLDLEGTLEQQPLPALRLGCLPEAAFELPGAARARLVHLWNPPCGGVLQVDVVPQGDGHRAFVHVDTSRVHLAEAELIVDEWCREVAGLVGVADAPPSAEVPRSSAVEAMPIPDRIATAAGAHPRRTAVADATGRLSYAALMDAADALAARLREQGAGPEARVGLCLEPSREAIVGFLGVLRAGAAVVCVNPDHPPQRIKRLLHDAGCIAVVGPPGTEREPWARGLPVVAALGHPQPAPSPASPHPCSLAYVTYTSGTTGKPKGVAVEHRQLAHYAEAIAHRLDCQPGEAHALMSSLAVDLGYTALVAALATGGTLHVFSQEQVRDGRAVEDYLREHPVDYLKTTPSHFVALAAAGGGQVFPRKALILGGEGLAPGALDTSVAAAGGMRLLNHYGPTECTVGVMTGEGARPRDEPLDTLPLDTPIGDAGVWLLDDRLRPVRTWQVGEVYLSGSCVARGYLGQAAATAERFVPALHGPAGARMYRTGDRARRWPSGAIEILGRTDQQVSLRGFRIELAEIEAAMTSHPLVDGTVAELRSDEHGTPFLAAHVSTRVPDDRIIEDLPTHTLANGMTVAQVNRSETEFLWQEIFERETYFQHGIHLPEAPCVFDIGANMGMFTMQVCMRSPGARVYAFEPIRRTHRVLARNVALYAPGAKVFHAGVSDHPHRATFVCYPRQTMMSALGAYASAEEEEAVVRTFMENARRSGDGDARVLLDSLDDLLDGRFEGEQEECELVTVSQVIREEGIGHIDLLKIDVQRAETDVLQGIEDAHWPLIDQICMEFHDGGPGSPTQGRGEQLRALLDRRGFDAVIEQDAMLAGTDRFSLYAISRGRRCVAAAPRQTRAPLAPTALSSTALRAHCARMLPDIMLPAVIRFVHGLPTLVSGKVDRRALAEVDLQMQSTEPYVAPADPVEKALAAIWSEVLGGMRIGTLDNFFELGGHSLAVMRVLARIRDAFDVRLPVRDFFEGPTIAELAPRVLRAAAGAEGPHGQPAGPTPAGRRLEDQLAEMESESATPSSPDTAVQQPGADGGAGARRQS